jgi:hypothetical protein
MPAVESAISKSILKPLKRKSITVSIMPSPPRERTANIGTNAEARSTLLGEFVFPFEIDQDPNLPGN